MITVVSFVRMTVSIFMVDVSIADDLMVITGPQELRDFGADKLILAMSSAWLGKARKFSTAPIGPTSKAQNLCPASDHL